MTKAKIVLCEKIKELGEVGDLVYVKLGFANNYLLPKGLALRANRENIEHYKKIRLEIENENQEKLQQALKIGEKIKDLKIVISVHVHNEEEIFGSITREKIAKAIRKEGIEEIDKKMINVPSKKINKLGEHEIKIDLHPNHSIPLIITIVKTK